MATEDGKRVVFTDETGVRLDSEWAERVLGAHVLSLELGEAALDVEQTRDLPAQAAPARRRSARLVTREGNLIASMECDPGEIALTAKALLVALEAGNFARRLRAVRAAERVLRDDPDPELGGGERWDALREQPGENDR